MSSFRERLGVTITGFLIPLPFSTVSKIFFCVYFSIFVLAGYVLGIVGFVLNELVTPGEVMLEGASLWGAFSVWAVLVSWSVKRIADKIISKLPSNSFFPMKPPAIDKNFVRYQKMLHLLTMFGGVLAGVITAAFGFFPYNFSIAGGFIVGWVFAELSERYYY